jgi:Short C-terminal domain
MESKIYKGYDGYVTVNDSGIKIKRNFLLGGHLMGEKSIPYSSITAVQLKKSGLTAGYIQFSVLGGIDSKKGLMDSLKDENTIHFYSNAKFIELKELIESKIGSNASHGNSSGIHDLEKLAELRDKGIITEQEFAAKKNRILNE